MDYFYQCNNDDSHKLFKQVLNQNNFIASKNPNKSRLFLPCKYNYSNKSLNNLQLTNKNQNVMYVHNNYVLGTKEFIWKKLVAVLGRKKASLIMPKSYSFPQDIQLFKKEYSSNKLYIMKKELQRQKGLKITNDFDEIINSKSNDYIVVQEYLNNSMTYRSLKLNYRVYVLVTCDPLLKIKTAFMFNDGIISYSAKPEQNIINPVTNKIDPDAGISSFYSSKKMYDMGYPITIKRFLEDKVLPIQRIQLMKRFRTKLFYLLKALGPLLCDDNFKNKSHQLFGVDFFVNDNLRPKILEVNVGPGMDPYNNEDNAMRSKLMQDMLDIVLVNEIKRDNGFSRFWIKN